MTAMAMTADDLSDEETPALRLPRALIVVAGAVVLALVAGIVWAGVHWVSRQAVARVQIEGRFTHLKVADIDAVLRPLVDRRFGELDLPALRAAVQQLPWVARASVERVWPATVRVRAVERVPFARWNEAQLLDVDAQAFTPAAADLPDDLPKLAGTPGKEAMVTEMFRALSAQLKDSAFALAGLSRDARGEWLAQTTSGLELRLGRDDPQNAVATLLGPAERLLKNRVSEVKYIDLRYTNGFSVGWQAAPSATRKEAH